MKYTYAYKSSDGVRHEDSMHASSREEVFEALRKKGIKAIKVVAADGSKANGEVRGVRKRVVVGIVILAALVVGIFAFNLGEKRATVSEPAPTPQSDAGAETNSVPEPQSVATPALQTFQTSQARRQVIGDIAIIEKGIRTGWADVFKLEGDRFLASFAIPGVEAGQRSTNEEEMRRALDEKVEVKPDDPLEHQQIKAMVEGMKQEARRYLEAGGTLVKYGQRLIERQQAEIAIYNRTKADAEIKSKAMAPDAFEEYLEKRNDELRNLGIRPVVISE